MDTTRVHGTTEARIAARLAQPIDDAHARQSTSLSAGVSGVPVVASNGTASVDVGSLPALAGGTTSVSVTGGVGSATVNYSMLHGTGFMSTPVVTATAHSVAAYAVIVATGTTSFSVKIYYPGQTSTTAVSVSYLAIGPRA